MGATTTLLVTLGLLCMSSQSKAVTSPLKIRFNSDLLRDIFHRNDQDILNIFSNFSLGEFDLQNDNVVKEANISIVPRNGDLNQFNYDLSLDESKYLGVSSNDLKYTGFGEILQGETVHRFDIEGPVTQFRFLYDVKKNESGEGHIVFYKDFEFQVDKDQLQIIASGDAAQIIEGKTEDIKTWVHDEIVRMVYQIKNDTSSGAIYYVSKLPLLNLTPLVSLYHLAALADQLSFSNEYVEYGFTPISLNMVSRRETILDLQKPIQSTYAPLKENEDPSALQVLIDENFFNVGFQYLIAKKGKFSMREFMSRDPRFALFRQLLTTTTMGMAFPSFKEEYGEGKSVDIISTVSHQEIDNIIEGIAPSGFSLDSKGNFKVNMNIASQVVVEKKTGKWEDSRKLVMTLGIKGKIFISDAEFDNKTLVVYPRGFELSTLKIYKGEDEQFLEQMLAQSLIGVQLDAMKKSFVPKLFPLKNFENPQELECFGFNFTNMDVIINRGYLQLNANYKKIDTPSNPEFCDEFEAILREKPERMVQLLSDYIPGLPKDFSSSYQPGDMSEFAKRMGAQEMKAGRTPTSNKRERQRPIKKQPEPVKAEPEPPKFNIPDDVAQDLKEDL